MHVYLFLTTMKNYLQCARDPCEDVRIRNELMKNSQYYNITLRDLLFFRRIIILT